MQREVKSKGMKESVRVETVEIRMRDTQVSNLQTNQYKEGIQGHKVAGGH